MVSNELEPATTSTSRPHGPRPQHRRRRDTLLAALACLALALSALLAGSTHSCTGLILLAAAWLLFDAVSPEAEASQAVQGRPDRRRVVLVPERVASSAAAAAVEGPPPPMPAAALETSLAYEPRWAGTWRLDKARSELYESVMADMSVNWCIRKAMDAKVSRLIISRTATHLTLQVKSLVNLEDSVPLDGSWIEKPVPTGSKMKGIARLRMTKHSASELEMLTEFPGGWGSLRDTLTVAEDGRSFSRRIARSDTLFITRYFVLEEPARC